MIIPSIDLRGGHAVQLIGGKEQVLDAGDPAPIADHFGLAGEVAIVDLDAALGTGDNTGVITKLLRRARCRVGGGIRDLNLARRWLDAGATKIVLGTKAVPELLTQLPRERTIAALDAVHGQVVVEGWRTATGRTVIERMLELRELVGGFLVTFVEREGRLGGIDLEAVKELLSAAGNARVTVAGGVTTAADIRELDRLGADAQVGMALYTGKLGLADAIAAPLRSERDDGLWPTVVTDERGIALGLAWSSGESLTAAVSDRRGVYHSRSRGLWRKGETSGAFQELLRVDLDCDRDTLRFTVRQHGAGFCHDGTLTCWGRGPALAELERLVCIRTAEAPAGSYTKRLLEDPELLRAKLVEEAGELSAAIAPHEIAGEAADLLYFTLVRLAAAGVPLAQVEQELEMRARRLSRRPGDAKQTAP